MILAAIYALGEYRDDPVLNIPAMLLWHGTLNAFGFAFLGLWGWNLDSSRSRSPALVPPPGR